MIAELMGFTLVRILPVAVHEGKALGVARKLVEWDKVLQGYVDQYKYLASGGMRPSQLQGMIDALPKGDQIEGNYIFVASDHLSGVSRSS